MSTASQEAPVFRFPHFEDYLLEGRAHAPGEYWPEAERRFLEFSLACATAALHAGFRVDDQGRRVCNFPPAFQEWWTWKWADAFLKGTSRYDPRLADVQALYKFARLADKELKLSEPEAKWDILDIHFTCYRQSTGVPLSPWAFRHEVDTDRFGVAAGIHRHPGYPRHQNQYGEWAVHIPVEFPNWQYGDRVSHYPQLTGEDFLTWGGFLLNPTPLSREQTDLLSRIGVVSWGDAGPNQCHPDRAIRRKNELCRRIISPIRRALTELSDSLRVPARAIPEDDFGNALAVVSGWLLEVESKCQPTTAEPAATVVMPSPPHRSIPLERIDDMPTATSPNGTEPRRWAWPLYPLGKNSAMNCHDAIAKRPYPTGGNLNLATDVAFSQTTRPEAGRPFGMLKHDANVNQRKFGVGRRYYLPTAKDLSVVRRLCPDISDPENPNWLSIEIELKAAGHQRAALAKLTPPELLALLDARTKQPDPPPGGVNEGEWGTVTPSGDADELDAKHAKLQKRFSVAYLQFDRGARALAEVGNEDPTDEAVYNEVKANLPHGETLASLGTWLTYVSRARKELGELKKPQKPQGQRPNASELRSAVPADELD